MYKRKMNFDLAQHRYLNIHLLVQSFSILVKIAVSTFDYHALQEVYAFFELEDMQ